MLNILILEDNPLFYKRLNKFLANWEEVNSITITSSLEQFFNISNIEAFDFLLADLKLPDGNGIDAIKYFNSKSPNALVIVISSLADSASILASIRAGAVGYLQKDEGEMQIISALKDALNGGSPITPGIASTIFSNLRNQPSDASNDINNMENENSVNSVLTPREQEVINLISKGFTYKEVAQTLNMSFNTVPVHIRNIYKKMQANNRSEAVHEARILGILN